MVLDLCQNFVSVQFLEKKFMEFDQTLHIYNRVMALDLCQNFVSVQFLETKIVNFHKSIKELKPLIGVRISFLHMH